MRQVLDRLVPHGAMAFVFGMVMYVTLLVH
jgi:hypothetical protein